MFNEFIDFHVVIFNIQTADPDIFWIIELNREVDIICDSLGLMVGCNFVFNL